jgi:PKD repeat protein
MNKNRILRWLLVPVLLVSLALITSMPHRAYADTTPTTSTTTNAGATDLSQGGEGLTIPNGTVAISSAISQKTLGETIISIVNYFIGFLGLIATVFIIYAGVLLVVSAGNEEAVTKGKKILTYSAVGFIVIILSYSIVSFIAGAAPNGSSTTGEQCGDTVCKQGESCVVSADNKTKSCVSNQTTGKTACIKDADCPSGNLCTSGFCEQNPAGTTTSEPTTAAPAENTSQIDSQMNGLKDELDDSSLSDADKAKIDEALKASDLDGKIAALKDLKSQKDTSDSLSSVIDRLIDGLERLQEIQTQLDKLNDTMPQSKDILSAYDSAKKALDALIASPTDPVLYNRFESSYKTLEDLILKFPMVQSHIRALPGEGNAPLTVQLDGLDSFDPTGGTISDYKWTLDGASLGDQPVIMHTFTTPNTYAVKLQVSTSQKDSTGTYKTAMDGISVIRIRVDPPASQVKFRINGVDAYDLYHVTSAEAQAGLSFDPTPTTPSLGRTLVKYEWSFGDSAGDVRQTPATVVHSYSKAGEYYVKLEVTDNLGVKDKRIVDLLVKSLAADIRVSPSEGDVNTTFDFSADRSRSDDGFIKSYDWEIVDANGQSVTTNSNTDFSYQFDHPGTYKVNLTVTDLTGATDATEEDLKVDSRPPVANFTYSIPQKNHPARVEFNAIDSYDPDPGDTITYSWDFNGDGTYEVTNSKDSVATYEYPRKGDFKATLQVEDSYGLHSSVDKKVTIDSTLSADIGVDHLAARVGDTLNFTADNSNAVAYVWEFGDGETLNTDKTTATHAYAKSGKFMAKLNFFGKDDDENSATQRILIGSGDKPLAVISTTVNGTEPPTIDDLCGQGVPGIQVNRADLIRFDAQNSMNTDGTSHLLDYEWKFPDGETFTTRDTTYKFSDITPQGQCFKVSLVTRDHLSGKISDEDSANFSVVNQLPQITDFVISAPDPSNLVTPAKIHLKAVNPKDLDGTIKSYRWYYYREGAESEKLGLHSTATPETDMVITSNGEPGVTNRYHFVLEITDNDNGMYSTQERFGEVSSLDIKNGPNLSPVAEFSMDKSTITVGDSITFISKSYDPQGDTLPNDAFRWDFDGDGQFDDTTSGPQVNRQYNTPGEFDVHLKVVYRGLSSSATHKVVVEAANVLPQAAFNYTIDGNTVNFDASGSRYDPSLKDTTLRFQWDFDTTVDSNGNGIPDDDIQSTDMKPTFTYDQKGAYTVKLTVIDSLGMKGVVTRKVDLSQTEADRQKNAYHTLKVTATSQPLTTLEIQATPATLSKGESADLVATVLNADGSPYAGKVYFEILEGGGQFSPNPVDAKESKASTVFNATDTGSVRIRVRATGTLYGDLEEEMTLTVK